MEFDIFAVFVVLWAVLDNDDDTAAVVVASSKMDLFDLETGYLLMI